MPTPGDGQQQEKLEKKDYHSWSPGEPNYRAAQETCVVMTSTGQWADRRCNLQQNFVCFKITEKNKKEYVYIPVKETWSSALTYCRTHHRDLALIENVAENAEAQRAIPTGGEVWIGLYRVPWTWSDQSQTSFQPGDYTRLNNAGGNQHCGTRNNLHDWGDENCSIRRVFICHQVLKKTTTVMMTTVRIKYEADMDWADPAISSQILQQLGALLTRQGWADFKLGWKTLPSKIDKEEGAKSKSKSHV